MNKIKELLTKLTTGKNKKFFYIGLGVIVVLIIFLSLNKQTSLRRNNKTTKNNEQIGNEYIGVKQDEGLRYSSFTTEIITFNDIEYGDISITIKGQLFYRENHDKSYYLSHPYDKKTIAKQIKYYIENGINQILSESEDIKYNQLRNIINNESITEKIKEQVSELDFTFEKVDIYTFALTEESINKIKEIEVAKRPQVPTKPTEQTNPEEITENIN